MVAVGLVAGCTSTPPPWSPARRLAPHPQQEFVPSDAGTVYRAMGLLTDTTRVRFVGSLRFLAGTTSDSTLAVFAVSLRNSSLTFAPQGRDFIAGYHVEFAFRKDSASGADRSVARDETVRVSSVRETQRRDESVVFQEFVRVPPGAYQLRVVVRDANSPAVATAGALDTVPRFAGPSLGVPIPIYDGSGRGQLGAAPKLVVNPRGALHYGPDSLRVYVEGYHWKPGTRVAARVVAADSAELWRDTVALSGDTVLGHAQIVIRPGALPLGRGMLHLDVAGGPATAHAELPILVTFSDRWAVGRFSDFLTLLRYYKRQDLVDKLRSASREQRAAAWRDFNRGSDPDTLTPQNEMLVEYLQRVVLANQRFAEPTGPGWQTDRGEVFVTLGDPDHTFETGGTFPTVRWEYTHPHLMLVFRDASGGLGQYRLTPESRIDFDHAVEWVRRTP